MGPVGANRAAGAALIVTGAQILLAGLAWAIASDSSTAMGTVEFITSGQAGNGPFYGFWAAISIVALAVGLAYLFGWARTRPRAKWLLAVVALLIGASVLAGLSLLAAMLVAASLFALHGLQWRLT